MAKRNWADGALGNTPLNAARLNQLEADLEAALLQLARNPEALFAQPEADPMASVAEPTRLVTSPPGCVWPEGAKVAGTLLMFPQSTFPAPT